ncbi:MAG: hypothetical protein ACLSVD_01045 [Eggerthellaceae bacterium]
MPELFRVMPASRWRSPSLRGQHQPARLRVAGGVHEERLASALSGEDVYVYGCDDEDEYEVMEDPPAKSPREEESAKHEKKEREYVRGKARSAR